MVTGSDDSVFRVLLELRLKGFSSQDDLAPSLALDADDVGRILSGLAADGLAAHREGSLGGWVLSAAGRRECENLAARQLDATGTRTRIEDAYARFLSLNPSLLDLCTRWQLREIDGVLVANDHGDPIYDTGVIDRLAQLHRDALAVCEDLADVLERFGAYGPRLARAFQLVRDGETDWFDKPLIDSYHTVWFELHENLLATLGIERGGDRDVLEVG